MEPDVILTYLPRFFDALLLTLHIGWKGVLISIGIGIAGAAVLHMRIPIAGKAIAAYTQLFRNTPLLVQLFFLYFALPRIGIRLSPESCGTLGLGLLGGAYMTETFRSALENVPQIQSESAESLGMSRMQALRHVIFPQALASGITGLVANIVFLLKETSVFSTISLMDLMFTAKDLIGMYAKTLECLTLLVIFYLIMLLPVSVLGSLLERRLRYAEFGD